MNAAVLPSSPIRPQLTKDRAAAVIDTAANREKAECGRINQQFTLQHPAFALPCLQALNSEPLTLNSEPLTLNSEPLTLNSEPLTLNSEPLTLNSEPLTLNSEPLTLNSEPLTLDSEL